MAIIRRYLQPEKKKPGKPQAEWNLRERELAKPVANWLREQGYTVYSEICTMGWRQNDLVGIRQNDIIIVELKMSLSKNVIRQCALAQLITVQVYAAVGTNPKQSSIELAKRCCIGVLSVKNNKANIVCEPTEKYKPYGNYTKECLEICRNSCPSDEAGIPNLKGGGPAQECKKRVDEYRKQNPKARWKDIFKNVPNHYSNHNSMAGAMSQVVNRA